jgi:uncharacterized lipoprotein YddW (UPF0748 family)
MVRARSWSPWLIAVSLLATGLGVTTGAPGAVAQTANASDTAASLTVDAVDPTALSNPPGAPFPGFRGGNQLIVYTQPGQTGTNEYGFEVTVEQGRVVRRDGADSVVPSDGFVISGHGSARTWILKNLPIGTKVVWQPGDTSLSAEQDPAADIWRARSLWSQMQTIHAKPPVTLEKRMAALEQLAATAPAAAATQARQLLPELQQTLWAAYKPLPAASRAVWYRPVEKDAAAVAATVARMKLAGIQTVYLESLFHGYPIYPSDTYRQWGLVNQYPRFAGWDPLAAFVGAAREHGMTVVPWVHTLYVGHDSLKPASPILAVHPAWANRQRVSADSRTPVASTVEGGAFFLDPVQPEVRRFLQDVLVELVTRYPIPAVQLDDTRYPMPFPTAHPEYLASTWGYSPLARAGFRQRYGQDPATLKDGTPAWSSWTGYRRDQLSDLVRDVSQAIHRAKSTVKVQMPFATNPQESYDRGLQDWPAWADNHLVDAFAVLNYTNSLAAVRQNVRYAYYATAGTVPLIGGIFGPFLAATPTETLAQAAAARDEGAEVVGLFSWQQVTPELTQAMRAGMFAPLAATPGLP